MTVIEKIRMQMHILFKEVKALNSSENSVKLVVSFVITVHRT